MNIWNVLAFRQISDYNETNGLRGTNSLKRLTASLTYYGTLGPSCQTEETLYELFRQGMAGVRLNLSHTGLEQSRPWLEELHKAAGRAGIAPQLLIDLQGPELRVGILPEPLRLVNGASVLLGQTGIPVSQSVVSAVIPGQEILLDDGALLLRVATCMADTVSCDVERGGVLYSRKSIAVPGVDLYQPTLTDQDLYQLSHAKEYGVTGVMLPFVRDAQDLMTLRETLRRVNNEHIQVFAKIENLKGVEALPDLLPYADHIVIARGDLGNSMPLWELPCVQKQIAGICKDAGVPFMVVTQLLHSMQKNAVPTRAEVSDIFNAVLDGASSLMLTGETAVGDYPIEAMRYLVKTAESALQYCQ